MKLPRAATHLAALFFALAIVLAMTSIAAPASGPTRPTAAATARPPAAHQTHAPLRVLFVGNSLTYYNNLPALVEAVYRSAVPKGELHTEMLAQGGLLIRQHLKSGHLQQVLDAGHFDVVVLQEKGGLPFCAQNSDCDDCSFYEECLDSPVALREAIALIQMKGPRVVLYGTWSGIPERQTVLSDALRRIAADTGASLADVGTAMHQFAYHPGKPVVWDATAHPTEIGSWLAAVLLVRAITETPLPDIVPQRTCVPDWSHQHISGDSLASSQTLPPSRCFSLAKTEFEQLRFVSMQGDY